MQFHPTRRPTAPEWIATRTRSPPVRSRAAKTLKGPAPSDSSVRPRSLARLARGLHPLRPPRPDLTVAPEPRRPAHRALRRLSAHSHSAPPDAKLTTGWQNQTSSSPHHRGGGMRRFLPGRSARSSRPPSGDRSAPRRCPATRSARPGAYPASDNCTASSSFRQGRLWFTAPVSRARSLRPPARAALHPRPPASPPSGGLAFVGGITSLMPSSSVLFLRPRVVRPRMKDAARPVPTASVSPRHPGLLLDHRRRLLILRAEQPSRMGFSAPSLRVHRSLARDSSSRALPRGQIDVGLSSPASVADSPRSRAIPAASHGF